MALLEAFGGTGLLLAAVGLYGSLARSVRGGSGEIGLRIALGAAPASVVRLVLRQGLRLVVAGLALGAAGAVAVSEVLSSQLFGVTAQDPRDLRRDGPAPRIGLSRRLRRPRAAGAARRSRARAASGVVRPPAGAGPEDDDQDDGATP